VRHWCGVEVTVRTVPGAPARTATWDPRSDSSASSRGMIGAIETDAPRLVVGLHPALELGHPLDRQRIGAGVLASPLGKTTNESTPPNVSRSGPWRR